MFPLFFPTITKPTRETDKSATLIDSIFYNNYVQNTSSLTGILHTGIIDHFPIFHIDYFVCVPLVDKSFKKSVYSMLNMERFYSTKREMDWDNVLHNSNVHITVMLTPCSIMNFVIFITPVFP